MGESQTEIASDRVSRILAKRILSGKLRPGASIKQDQLAAELGISRIPVRDALRILEGRGLITLKSNFSARVVELSLRDVEINYELRERIEPMLMAESLPGLTDPDIAELQDVYDSLQESNDLEETDRLGRAFHMIVYRRHNTPHLAQIVERLWDMTQLYRHVYSQIALSQNPEILRNDHRLLFEAIRRREVEIAQAALVLHIRRSRLCLSQYIRPQP
jgi:DNA-binding GntR family transcriptional regulator